MKVWWVIGYDTYYPGGGLSDVLETFETKEEAEQYAKVVKEEGHRYTDGWVFNPENVEVENVSSYLGLEE